jgi:hypothetical protein
MRKSVTVARLRMYNSTPLTLSVSAKFHGYSPSNACGDVYNAQFENRESLLAED